MNTKEELTQMYSNTSSCTSMITLLLPAGTQIWLVLGRLTNEAGTASNIKDKTNRKSVEAALRSLTDALKLLRVLPSNGLACL